MNNFIKGKNIITKTLSFRDKLLFKDIEVPYAPVVNALKKYYENPSVQLHIPGHTRGEAILKDFRDLIGDRVPFLDTTDEFDNLGTLHPATGPIAEAQELAAKAFGAKKTFFLLNGSTIGNLALGLTLAKENQSVIVGRNSHRSVLTSLIMSGANPVWVMPEKLDNWGLFGEITPESIEDALKKNRDAAFVWVTSPTYEGIVSDIKSIAEVCRRYDVPLIVDEAHGCLWNFNKELPESALKLGADAVVHSLHKTGGSFSQSSMLHVAENSRINLVALEANLKLLHSTSPSYLLLASLDSARAYLQSRMGHVAIEKALKHSKYLRQRLSSIEGVECLSSEEKTIDPTKIFLKVRGLSGKRLETILEVEYHIEIESASDEGILILSNIGNKFEDIEYFCDCIESIIKSGFSDISHLETEESKYMPLCEPDIVMSPRKAHQSETERIPLGKAIGRICAEVIAECPPGISILMPGELIEEKHLPYLTHYKEITVIKK